MTMKVSEFDGRPAIYVRWHTRKPKAGEHLTLYDDDDPTPHKQPVGRLLLRECVCSRPHAIDKNQTEEWWSFDRVSEHDFHRMRHSARRAGMIEKTHDSLFG